MTTRRAAVLATVARAVPDPARVGHPVRVGVDGPDGSGKTWFADELAVALRDLGREVVRVSVDGFHRPRAARYARGAGSPEGFYRDSYDYERFRVDVLDPFAHDGDRVYRDAAHDVTTDRPLDVPPRTAGEHAVLVVDGIFLHRDELAAAWDLSVYLDVPVAVTCRRMAVRDGSPPDPSDARNVRYVRGQELYRAQCDPAARASFVVDNADLASPAIRSGGTPARGHPRPTG